MKKVKLVLSEIMGPNGKAYGTCIDLTVGNMRYSNYDDITTDEDNVCPNETYEKEVSSHEVDFLIDFLELTVKTELNETKLWEKVKALNSSDLVALVKEIKIINNSDAPANIGLSKLLKPLFDAEHCIGDFWTNTWTNVCLAINNEVLFRVSEDRLKL